MVDRQGDLSKNNLHLSGLPDAECAACPHVCSSVNAVIEDIENEDPYALPSIYPAGIQIGCTFQDINSCRVTATVPNGDGWADEKSTTGSIPQGCPIYRG